MMNERYYKESLLRSLAYDDDINGNCDGKIDFTVIDSISGADVAPVIHGEWTHRRWTTECDWGCINHRSVICSACGTEFIDKEPTNYCPECGAKMKERENNK